MSGGGPLVGEPIGAEDAIWWNFQQADWWAVQEFRFIGLADAVCEEIAAERRRAHFGRLLDLLQEFPLTYEAVRLRYAEHGDPQESADARPE